MLRGTPTESGIRSSDIGAHVTLVPRPSDDDASHRVTVSDTELLFSAHFSKSGGDLVLTGPDGRKLVLSGYFDHDRHADLVAPGGAILTADVVAKLTISQTPGQYAQAGAPAGAVVIGKVERLGGSATVQHANGTVEELKVGDPVYQGDVVETGGGSTLGMSFVDGTAFNMGATARMVLSELIYDANSNSNSGVFSLVKGTITFVAGKVAKTGDMRVETPVATMGIRGTSVNTTIDTDIGGNTVSVTYSLMRDPDGHIGSFNIMDRVTGAIIGTITTTDTTFVVTPTANLGVLATQLNKTPEQIAQELANAAVLFPIFLGNPANFNNQNVNPQNGTHGSGTPPGGSQQNLPGNSNTPGNGNNGGTINRTDGGTNGDGNGGTFHVGLPHTNAAPSVFADTPSNLVEAVSLGSSGTATSIAHIFKVDTDGTVGYDTAGLVGSGWVDFGNGIFGKLGTYGAAALNTGGATVASLVAAGWTNLGNGYLEKSVSFGAGGNATIRVSSDSDTVTYALDNDKADPLRLSDHPTESFNIPVIDNDNARATTTAVFTVDGRNDPPSIVTGSTTATGAVVEDSDPATLTAAGTITFKDAELTDAHTLTGTPAVPSSVTVTDGNGHSEPLPGFNPATDYLGTLTLTVVEDTSDSNNIGTVQWSFSVNDNDPRVQALAVGQVITQVYTITIDDGNGGTVQQQITVTITGSNDDPNNSAPVIVAGSVVTGAFDELTTPAPSTGLTDTDSATGTIKFVDIDLIDTHTAATSFVSAVWTKAGGTTASIADPGGLTLSAVNEDPTDTNNQGSVDWTYSATDANLDFLAAGETLVVTYNVTITDNTGSSVTQSVTVTITGTNDVPAVAVGDVTGAVTELVTPAGNLTDTGTISFTDVDLTDSHSISPTITPSAGALGSLTASVTTDTTSSGTGGVITWNYTVADSLVEYLAKDQTKVETFTITLDDGNGGTVDRTISVTITGTNDTPVVAVADVTGAVTELVTPVGSLTDTGTISFTDVDLTDSHSISPTITPSAGALGSLTASVTTDTTGSGSGGVITWNYTVLAGLVEYLAKDQTKVETFTITLDDGNGGTVDRAISVTITGTNDAPILSNEDLTGTVLEQGTPSGNLTDNGTIAFTDVDLTDVHLVSANGTPIGTTLGTLTAVKDSDTTGTGSGGQLTWTYSVSASAVEYLAKDQTKVESFIITLTDQNGSTINRQIDVTITGTNDAPVVAAVDVTGAVTEQVTSAGNLTDAGTISFTDVDLTDSHGISPTITPSAGALGTLTASVTTDTTGSGTGGVITRNYTVADSLVEYLAKDQTKVETFTITLDDGNGGTVDRTISVTITGTNDAPTIAVNGGDGDTSTTSFNETNGSLLTSGTLSVFDVDVLDTVAASVASVAVTGTGIGSLPGALDNAALKAMLSVDSGNVIGNAATSGTIHWAFSSTQEAFNFLATGETLVLTYTVRATDSSSDHATADQTVTVTITGTNDNAVITTASGDADSGAVREDDHATNETATGTLSFSDFDITDTHSVTGVTPSAGALGSLTANVTTDTASGTGGVITWNYTVVDSAIQTLSAGQTKTETFTISLNDGHSTVTKDVTVTITGTNDAPVIDLDTTAPAINASLAYTENGTSAAIAPHAAVTDIDSADFNGGSLIVSFTANGTPSDQLAILTDGTVTLSGNDVSVDGVVIGTFHPTNNGLNGASLEIDFNSADATPAAVSKLMQHIGFSNSSDDPSALPRTVEFKIVDGDGVVGNGHDTAQLTATVNVTPVNDAPAFSGGTAGTAYLERGAAVTVAANVAASDVDSANYDHGSLTVSITGNAHAGDTLRVAGNDFITVTSGGDVMFDSDGAGTDFSPVTVGHLNNSGSSLTIDLNAAATDAAVVALAQAIQFSNFTSHDPTGDTRTVTFTLNDGGGTANNGQDTASFTATVAVTPVNDAPAFTGNSAGATYLEQGGSVSVAAGVSASDIDSTNYNGGSLTATVTAGGHQGDTLFIPGGDFITVTSGGNVMFDSDGTGAGAAVQIGHLTNNINSLTIDFNAAATDDAVVALTQAIQFSNFSSDDPTGDARTVTFTLKDGGGTDNGGQDATFFNTTINVTPINDAPVFSGNSAGTSYMENGSAVLLATGVSASDVDSTNYNSGSLTATITAGGHSGDGLSIVANDFITVDSGGNVMFDSDGTGTDFSPVAIGTLTNNGTSLTIDLNGDATDAAVVALSQAVAFSSTSDDPTADPRTVTFTLNDGGGTANNGQNTAAFDVTVSVTPVNDAPSFSGVSGTTAFTELGSPVKVLNAATVSDVDNTNFDHGSLTAAITAHSHAGDTLSIAANDFITVDSGGNVMFDSDGTGTDFSAVAIGTLTNNGSSLSVDFNSSATSAGVAALSKAVQFGNDTSHDPTNETRTVTFTLVDGGGTGNGGHDTASFNAFVSVTPVNDAPVLGNDNVSVTASAGGVATSFTPLVFVDQTQGDQPFATSAADGNHLLFAWASANSSSVYSRLFDSSGAPLGNGLLVDANSGNLHLTKLAGGGFALLQDPQGVQVLDSSGGAVGNFSSLPNAAGYGAIVSLTGGGFVVTETGSSSNFAYVYSPSGQQIGTVTTSGISNEYGIREAVGLNDGGFLFAWKDSSGDIFVDTYDASGANLSSPQYQLNADHGGIQWYADLDLAKLSDGRVLAVWSQNVSGDVGVYGRFLDSSGQPISGSAGDQFKIGDAGSLNAPMPIITEAADGRIVVAWYEGTYPVSWGAPGDASIHYQVVGSNGALIGSDQVLTTQTPGPTDLLSSALQDGSVVFAWRGYDSNDEGSHFAIVGSSGSVTQPDTAIHIGNDVGRQIPFGLSQTSDGVVWMTYFDESSNLDGSGTGVGAVKLVSGAGTTINGALAFTDQDASDTHTASFVAQGTGYVGDFGLGTSVTEPNGSAPGSVNWHFNITPSDSANLNAPVTQSYDVTVTDSHNESATKTVAISIGTVNGDTLDGANANVLIGGAGADTFTFHGNFGRDVVADFVAGTDAIELDGTVAGGDFNTLLNQIDDSTGSSVITIDPNNTITLTNVLKQALSANDFHFV